jgi:hypothetical protein
VTTCGQQVCLADHQLYACQTGGWQALGMACGGPSLPDVVINHLAAEPSSPDVGDAVNLIATVQNIGSGPTPAGVLVGVGFSVSDGFNGFGQPMISIDFRNRTRVTTTPVSW